MKVRSNREPQPLVYVRNNNDLVLTFAENVSRITRTIDEEEFTEYEYDRYVLVVPYRSHIIGDIENNTAFWLNKARTEEYNALCKQVDDEVKRRLEETDSEYCIDRIIKDLSSVSTTALTAKLKELAKSKMTNYRQALRDVNKQPGYPYNVTYPQKPM